jgi:hypothetical protein
MFQACFEICRTHEDLLAPTRPLALGLTWAALGLAAAASVWRRMTGRLGVPVVCGTVSHIRRGCV